MSSALAAAILIASCASNTSPKHEPVADSPARIADTATLYTQGTIHTQNREQPIATAMLVEDGVIRFIGSDEAARSLVGEKTAEVNLAGKTVLPGLIDGHTHPGLVAITGGAGGSAGTAALLAETRDETLAKLREFSKRPDLPPYIIGGPWNIRAFLPTGPTKEELDEIFPNRPAILIDNTGHSYWLNSAALAALKIDENTPDVSEGVSYFVRDKAGEPTGWAKEFVLMRALNGLIPKDKAATKSQLAIFVDFLSKNGVTTLFDAGNFLDGDFIYEIVSELDAEGRLPLNYEGCYHIWDPSQIDGAVAELSRLRTAYQRGRLTLNTIKIHYDGITEVGTAAVLEPYADGSHGNTLFPTDRLAEFIVELDNADVDLHLHTVGGSAVRSALDAVEQAGRTLGRQLRIEVTLSHLMMVSNEDTHRFSELNVHANFTPQWFGGTMVGGTNATMLGKERMAHQQLPLQLMVNDANVTFGSDVIVGGEAAARAAPLIGVEMAVTRREYSNPLARPFGPAAAGVSREGALRAYTLNAARQFGREAEIGSLAVGKKADFVVFDKDPMKADISEVHTLTPSSVFLEGKAVFEAR